jgi:hypothetical protein
MARVRGVTAATTASWSSMGTKVVVMPHLEGKKSLSSAKVPPYTALLHTMWSPAEHSASSVADTAAMPEAQQ